MKKLGLLLIIIILGGISRADFRARDDLVLYGYLETEALWQEVSGQTSTNIRLSKTMLGLNWQARKSFLLSGRLDGVTENDDVRVTLKEAYCQWQAFPALQITVGKIPTPWISFLPAPRQLWVTNYPALSKFVQLERVGLRIAKPSGLWRYQVGIFESAQTDELRQWQFRTSLNFSRLTARAYYLRDTGGLQVVSRIGVCFYGNLPTGIEWRSGGVHDLETYEYSWYLMGRKEIARRWWVVAQYEETREKNDDKNRRITVGNLVETSWGVRFKVGFWRDMGSDYGYGGIVQLGYRL